MNDTLVDLVIVIPIYNEEGAIEKVIHSWTTELKKIGTNFEIHVYNDGSTDNTINILNNLIKKYDRLIIHNKANSGHGPTILQGYIDNCLISKWIFQIDSDDEMEAKWFSYLWDKRYKHDFIIGRRSGRKSPLSRKLVSLCSRIVVNLFYGSGVNDVNCPYRLMKADVFRPCFFSIPKNTFAPNVIISGFAALKKIKTFEIDIPHRNRTTGTVSIRKMSLLKGIIKSFIQTIYYRFSTTGHCLKD